jgi:hypothetical protein
VVTGPPRLARWPTVAGNLFERVTSGPRFDGSRVDSSEIVDAVAETLVQLNCGRCRALSRKEDFNVF